MLNAQHRYCEGTYNEGESYETAGHKLYVLEGIEALQPLLPAWEELLKAVPDASIFSTWEWLSSWWEAFGARRNLITLAMTDSGDRLVGIAPLSVETRWFAPGRNVRLVRLMGDGSGDSDNLGVPVLPGHETLFISTVLDYLERHKRLWDAVQFNTFSDESRIPAYLLAELRRRKWSYFWRQAPGLIIDLPGDWESCLRQMSARQRSRVRKYLRNLDSRSEFRIRKSGIGSDLPADLNRFFDLHQRRWLAVGEPGAFADARRRQFYTALAASLARRGWLEFWFLELNGECLACEFDFRYRATVYRLQSAFHLGYAEDGVGAGHLLISALLQRFIDDGAKRYDFLGGDETYKQSWGGRTRYYSNIHFAIPGSLGSIYLWVITTLSSAKAIVRPHFPATALSAYHRWKAKLETWSVLLDRCLRRALNTVLQPRSFSVGGAARDSRGRRREP
jgi:CelD/BcsL family acetyltransferase involved in cellulose biosynthesis